MAGIPIPSLTGGAAGPAYSGGANDISAMFGDFYFKSKPSNNVTIIAMFLIAGAAWAFNKK